MNKIQIFENPEFGSIRTVEVNNEPWFVGKDVAEVLGYSNTRKALADHVKEHHKSDGVTIRDSIGREQQPIIIDEAGFYALVLRSKLPQAEAFQEWVASEVLPSIRKHKVYMTPEKIEEVLTNPDTIIKLATSLKEEQTKRREAEIELSAAKPKVIFADAVSASDSTILIGDMAKLIKQNGHPIGQKRLFQWMRDKGYLIKRQGAEYNSPTQRAMEKGLFRIKETAITHSDGHVTISKTVKVTGKGQQYFINKFAERQKGGEQA